VRLLHLADLHLGIENYGRIDSGTGLHTRLQDFVQSLAGLLDQAISEQFDAVLLAGDVYRTPAPNPTWQREFAEQLRRLQEAGIPLALVVGNHDTPAAVGRATSVDVFTALDLPLTHIYRRPGLQTISTAAGPLQIAALPWPTRHWLLTLDDYRSLSPEEVQREIRRICASQIQDMASQLDASQPAVLLAHVAAAEATYSGAERTALIGNDPTLLTGQLADPRFDYVALGHVHKHQILNDHPPVVYSGSIERVDFGEEHEQKGGCIVDIEAGATGDSVTRDASTRRTTVQFVSSAPRPMLTIDVDARGHDDPTACLETAITAAEIDGAIVRIRYSVDPGAPVLDPARLRLALEPAHVVAGLLPAIAPRERQRRAGLHGDLSTAEALDRYLENRPDLASHHQPLRQLAAEIERDLELELRGETE
jgi:DNA repair protein SbcD/Mre11